MVTWAAAILSLALQADGTAASTRDWAGEAFGPHVTSATANGPIRTDDLIRLRNLGGAALSPDARRIAFSAYQAVPERNEYVTRWFVVPTDGSKPPSTLPIDGGQPIPAYIYGLPHAYVPASPPTWSPDGRYLALRRMVDDRIEVWIVDTTSASAQRIFDGASQATSIAWTSSSTLAFRTGLNHGRWVQRLDQEAKHGWLIDGRVPFFAARAKPTEPDCALPAADAACDVADLAFDLGGVVRPASTEERRLLSPARNQGPATARRGPSVAGKDGKVVATIPVDASHASAAQPYFVLAAGEADHLQPCAAKACTGRYFKELGWARRGQAIWFMKSENSLGRAEDAPGDVKAIYEWRPGGKAARLIAKTEDIVRDCVAGDAALYCVREGSTLPPRLVAISLDSGRETVLADPNPQFAAKSYPTVRKLMLNDSAGNPAFAHVILPYGYASGQRYPLVVTQYRSKGFLRGNVGDEYPIFPLAAEGFVVLDFDRPEQTNFALTKTDAELRQAYSSGGRQRVLSALDQAIDALVREGLVDQKRMAITGFSAGAESVHYALQQGRPFAAAIASGGNQDLTFFALVPEGPWRSQLMASFDAQDLIPKAGSVIYDLAWSRQPEKLHTPLLLNLGEHEAMLGFEGFEALKHAKRPLEVRVFPDEMHVKYHPQTYAGIYDNNMMWLKFWLLDKVDPRPEFAAQYKRWNAMRDQMKSETSVTLEPK